jgi:hypothetical protein
MFTVHGGFLLTWPRAIVTVRLRDGGIRPPYEYDKISLINTVISHIDTVISHIDTVISHIDTVISHIDTVI